MGRGGGRHDAAAQWHGVLDLDTLRSSPLRDGVFTADVFGYSDNIRATVTVRNARMAEVKLDHREKADLNARTILPERMVREQRIDVDGITGATVTSQAIKGAVFQALKSPVNQLIVCGKEKKGDLVLQGSCAKCAHEAVRLVETSERDLSGN